MAVCVSVCDAVTDCGCAVCWPRWSTSWGRSELPHPGPAELLQYLLWQHIHPDHWQTGWRGLWVDTQTCTICKSVQCCHTSKAVRIIHGTLSITSTTIRLIRRHRGERKSKQKMWTWKHYECEFIPKSAIAPGPRSGRGYLWLTLR